MRSKIFTVFLFTVFFIFCKCSQQSYYSLGDATSNMRGDINTQGMLLARKILKEDCRADPNPEKYFDGTTSSRKQFAIYDVNSMTFVPVALFEVMSKENSYKGVGIVNFLEWKKTDLIGFYSFKNEKFEGLLDWSGEHHFNIKKECSYLTINNHNQLVKEPYWLGYRHLIEMGRETSFLFGVKYFVDTLWFVEDDEVFILDLKEMKIYDPDEFIKLKCYDGFIHDIASGGQIICNY